MLDQGVPEFSPAGLAPVARAGQAASCASVSARQAVGTHTHFTVCGGRDRLVAVDAKLGAVFERQRVQSELRLVDERGICQTPGDGHRSIPVIGDRQKEQQLTTAWFCDLKYTHDLCARMCV